MCAGELECWNGPLEGQTVERLAPFVGIVQPGSVVPVSNLPKSDTHEVSNSLAG